MRTFVVTPPEPIVTYEQATARLKLAGGERERADVEAMIAAATSHIDGPDGWLGRTIGVQEIETRTSLDRCGSSIRLPFPPVIDLVSIKYLDANDDEQDADLADFELLGRDLVPAGSGWVWAGGSTRREALRIQYRAGYTAVPPAISTAILLMVGDLYRFRETAAVGVTAPGKIPMSMAVEKLLQPFWLPQ